MALTNSEWLALYETALQDVLSSGQSASNGGRSYTLADVKFLESMVAKYSALTARDAAGGGIPVRQVTPVDV